MLVWIRTPQCTHTNTLAFILTLFYSARGKKNFLLQEVFSPRQSIRTHGSAPGQSFICPPLCEWWLTRDKWWNTGITLWPMLSLTLLNSLRPSLMSNYPSQNLTLTISDRESDKNHHPILSSVQPSGLLMGMGNPNTICVNQKNVLVMISVKISPWFDLRKSSVKITSEGLIKSWSWDWSGHWWVWLHRWMSDCLSALKVASVTSDEHWSSSSHGYEGLHFSYNVILTSL